MLLHHPVVGDLDLPFESIPLASDPSQSLVTYTAEPGSPSQDALNLLASWPTTTADIELPEGLAAMWPNSRADDARRPG